MSGRKDSPGALIPVSRRGQRFHHRQGGPLDEKHQKRLSELAIPPAWKDLQVSLDPRSAVQATGVDEKGRRQSRYSPDWQAQASRRKFGRVRQLLRDLPQLRQRIHRLATRPGPHQEPAAVLKLIERTGFRTGSNKDTQSEVKAHGASNLQARHLAIDGDHVRFRFVGKKGVEQDQKIRDGSLARLLRPRLERGGSLFQTDDKSVRHLFKKLTGGKYHVKDLRTARAAHVAVRHLNRQGRARKPEELKKHRQAVGERVARHLGNTADVALKSYVPPEVFRRHARFSGLASPLDREGFPGRRLFALIEELADGQEPLLLVRQARTLLDDWRERTSRRERDRIWRRQAAHARDQGLSEAFFQEAQQGWLRRHEAGWQTLQESLDLLDDLFGEFAREGVVRFATPAEHQAWLAQAREDLGVTLARLLEADSRRRAALRREQEQQEHRMERVSFAQARQLAAGCHSEQDCRTASRQLAQQGSPWRVFFEDGATVAPAMQEDLVVLDWDDGLHPRDEQGRFAPVGGGGSADAADASGQGGRGDLKSQVTPAEPGESPPGRSRAADPEAWDKARAATGAAVASWLERSNLPAEKAQAYAAAARDVLDGFNHRSLTLLHDRIENMRFHDGVDKVTREFGELAGRAPGAPVGGFWSYLPGSKKGEIVLDGGRDTGEKYDMRGQSAETTRGIYAHEFAHALDGPSKVYSRSAEWRSAWEEEVQREPTAPHFPLSRYGARNASEGFAEAGRLFCLNPEAGKASFPRCWAFWKKYGLTD